MGTMTTTGDRIFAPVPRQATLASQVVETLEAFITESHLQPGDRIPPERQLADQFGVSRTVIREAVGRLAAKGLLEVSAGSGTIIRRPSVESVARSMSLCLNAEDPPFSYASVHEVRRMLETQIAGLAAERRTPDDLAMLHGLLDEAAAGARDRDSYVRADMAFHAALAGATHNRLFNLLLDSLSDILLAVRRSAFDLPGTPARALDAHRAIVERVEAGDPSGARHAMLADLALAESIQISLLEHPGDGS
jgi:GntR family transcriptional repressor for pyruvate dehydrogenase complex